MACRRPSRFGKRRPNQDRNIKNERQKIDSMNEQATTQLAELENERSKLKSLIESLIQQQGAFAEMNVEVTMILY